MTPFFSQVQKAKTALYKNGIPFEQKMIDVWVVHTCQQSSAIGARPPPVLSPATE